MTEAKRAYPRTVSCGESQVDHGAPFPERCWVCGFEMRALQAERFAKEFRGTVRIGPSTTINSQVA